MKILIREKETVIHTYIIEAESAKAAKEMWEQGDLPKGELENCLECCIEGIYQVDGDKTTLIEEVD